MNEEELMSAAESIFDGWYADSNRVDWDDFLDRLELQTDFDLGSDMGSPLIKKIKSHISNYRKLST